MLEPSIRKKLESLTELPTIPLVISRVMNALEDNDISAANLSVLIERDQTLTLRVLRVANSPFYGFPRKISTIDLAIVVLGLDSIKEIVLSLILQRLYSKVKTSVFNINSFWRYSVFCGACSRLLARKLGYRLAGEAFVCGLMHDIGILIIVEFFNRHFIKIIKYQDKANLSLIEAERKVLNTTHCDIGAWLAEKWNLPMRLCQALNNHHRSYAEVKMQEERQGSNKNDGQFPSALKNPFGIEQPLTALAAMSEWFAGKMGFMDWNINSVPSDLYLADKILSEIKEDNILHPESMLELLKQEILEEYEKAAIIRELPRR